MDRTALHHHVFETDFGFCAIAWSEAGIIRFQLPTPGGDAPARLIRRRLPEAEPGEPPAAVAAAIAAAQRYFSGEPVDFSDVVVDLDDTDAFFRDIYVALRQVGRGSTTTYGALARQLGAGPERARDVGEAMARNPVPLIIPCHRVLAAGGKLGGFSAPGGSNTKLRMLELEGVTLAAPPEPPSPPSQARFDF